MRIICWCAAAVVLLSVTIVSCGNLPRYACPDPSRPCDGSEDMDAGADGDAAEQ